MSKHLTTGQQALLTTELELRERELAAQLAAHLHGQTRTERAHELLSQDGDDAPQRMPERDIAAALTDREHRELDAVVAAMQRMEQGAYGQCADCGATVPFERLLVEPWATRCIGCATRREQASQRSHA